MSANISVANWLGSPCPARVVPPTRETTDQFKSDPQPTPLNSASTTYAPPHDTDYDSDSSSDSVESHISYPPPNLPAPADIGFPLIDVHTFILLHDRC